MQEMWQRKLGIEIRIQNMEFKSLLARLDAGDYDLSYLAWHGDYIDPMAFLEIWQSDSHFNRARWKEPRFDALIKAATKTADPVDRFAKLAEAETLLGKELPIIPIFWKTKDYLISPKVKQWPASLIDLRSYKGIKLSQ
jgi:oligopeptide transport system substrate-binding protein